MAIYIALHKQCEFVEMDQYVPIQVGSSLHPKLGYLTDNDGDNISDKNPNFCELTALYYIWKNRTDPMVGLVHYRRFFYKKRFHSENSYIIPYEEFEKIVDDNTIVLPQRHYFRTDNYDQYCKLHYKKDIDCCKSIIEKKYPQYVKSFMDIMNQKWLYPYNMFVMTRQRFEQYMEWLFSILFEAEKQIDITEYDDYNKRIFGFLSERLLNVWVAESKMRIVNYPVYNCTETTGQHIMEELENGIKKIL